MKRPKFKTKPLRVNTVIIMYESIEINILFLRIKEKKSTFLFYLI